MQKTIIRIIAVLLVALMCLTLLPIRSWADYTYTPNTCPGHNYTAQDTTLDGALKSAATCTNSAIYYYACANCGQLSSADEENANLTFSYGEPLGHSFTVHHDAVAATCTTAGTGAYNKCIRCDVTDPAQPETIAALGHEWVDDAVITPATCTGAGVMGQKCSRTDCNATSTREIPALGHTFVTEIRDTNATPVSAATCTSSAVYYKVCSVCGALSEDTFTSGSALGHDFSVHHNAVSATCTTAGTEAYDSCSRCTATQQENAPVAIPALGHNWVDDHTITAATCTTAGSMLQKCSRTGCNETRTVEIPALHSAGHEWENGVCKICHISAMKLTVTVNGSGTATFNGVTVQSGSSQTQNVDPNAPAFDITFTAAQGYQLSSITVNDQAASTTSGKYHVDPSVGGSLRVTAVFVDPNAQTTKTPGPHSVAATTDASLMEAAGTKLNAVAIANNYSTANSAFAVYEVTPKWSDGTTMTAADVKAHPVTFTLQPPQGTSADTHFFQVWHYENGSFSKRVSNSLSVTTDSCSPFAVLAFSKAAASTDPMYDPAAMPSVIASSVLVVVDDGNTQKGSVTLSTNGRQLEYVRSSSEPTSSTTWTKMTTNTLPDLADGGRYYFRYSYISSTLPASGWVCLDIGEWYTVTAQLLYGKGTYETDKPHFESFDHTYVVKKGDSIIFTFTPENRYELYEINVNGKYVGQSNVQNAFELKNVTAKSLVSFGFSSQSSSPKTPGPHSVAATTDTTLMEAAGTKLNAVAIANNYSTANSAFAVYEVTPKWSDGTTMTAADVKAHPVTFTLQAPQGTSADTHFFQVWHYENGSFSKRVSNSLSVTTDSCSPFAVLAFSKAAASTDPLYDPAAKPSVIASSVIDVIDDGDTQKGSVTLSTNGRQLEYVRSSSEPTSSTKWIKMTTNKLSDLAAGGRYYFRYTYISSALPESGWVYQDIGEWYTVTAQLLYGKGTYETDKPHYENYAHVYVVKKGESITFTFTPENRYWLHEINVNGRYVGQSNVQKTYVVKDITAKTQVSFGFSSYTSSPKTGDSSDLMKWGTMEIVSLLGMVSITWYLFRRKEY